MNGELKAVLVGCGSISQVWLSAIRDIPGLKIVGLVDVIPDKARHRADEFGLAAPVDADLAASLRDCRPAAVFDCTVPSQRLAIATTAFEHGCHVLAEKPLAETLDRARQIAGLARQTDAVYAVMQNHRYHAGSRRLASFLRAGYLGDLSFGSSTFAIGARFVDFRQSMQHVLLKEMAIHTFDLARLLLGAEPVSVYCKEWNPAGSSFAHDSSAVAVFEFDNGAIYNYEGSWCAQGLRTQWESSWRVNGTRGSVTWDGAEEFQCEVAQTSSDGAVSNEEMSIPPLDTSSRVGGHRGVITEFADCIRNGEAPETNVVSNIKSLQMVLAAVESSQRGEVVEIDTL